MKKLFIVLLTTLLLTSCMVSEKMTLNNSLKGESESKIEVDDFFTLLLEDFSSFSEEDASIMDSSLVNLAYLVSDSPSSSFVTLYKENDNYNLSFQFDNLITLLEDLNESKGNTIIKKENNTLLFNLNIDNYHELKEAIPFLQDPNFEVYGPEYSYGMSKEEYCEMIGYLLGDDAPSSLDKSSISIEINGETFSYPLIDFLLLNNPITFKIEL